jgi:nitrogen fixation protein FixH
MKPGTLWPIGIAGVLLATVAANIALFYVAGSDPSFVIEPNYYAKGIAWDSTMAQSAMNQKLGWHLAPSLAEYTVRDGAVLSVRLTDSTGATIDDATVKVAALYNARAATVVESTLQFDSAAYVARLPVSHRGQWELRFDVTRAGQRFTTTERVEAVEASPRS